MLTGKTIVVTGEKEIIESITDFQSNTNRIWRACVDSSLPSYSVNKVKAGYLDAKKRGVRIKYITEITKDNLEYCLEIMTFAELRHLDGVRGNFALSETEYVAGIKHSDAIVSLVRSSVEELVQQQHLVFETLWRHSVPADEKLRQII
ncbi:MAG: hypothetical protein ACREA4_05505 [Nitrososphaera sp.]